MAHYTRPQGPVSFIDEARDVARAAADIGVRATLAIAMRDRNPLLYGDAADVLTKLSPQARAVVEKQFFAPMPNAAEQVARVEARRRRGREPELYGAIRADQRAMVL